MLALQKQKCVTALAFLQFFEPVKYKRIAKNNAYYRFRSIFILKSFSNLFESKRKKLQPEKTVNFIIIRYH